MKIKMIGTGALTSNSRSSSILIDKKILIDCGNGIYKTMQEQKVDIENIAYLFITHMHGDHFFDIPFYIICRSIMNVEKELKIYIPNNSRETLYKLLSIAYPDIEDWNQKMESGKIKIFEYKIEKEIKIEDYMIKPVHVNHGKFKEAYGFVLKKGKDSIFISGDSTYCEQVENGICETKISILDISFVNNRASHMGVNNIEGIINKFPNKKIITTHMVDAAREELKKFNNKNIIVPDDGMEIEF